MSVSVNTATKRQLWALFCATKKDYRSENLTKEDASALLKQLSESKSKGSAVVPTKTKTKSVAVSKASKLEKALIEYYKEKLLPRVVDEIKDACGIVSVVENDPNFMSKKGAYVMRGYGCSISYLTYDKRSKKAAEIEDLFRKHRFTTFEQLAMEEIEKELGSKFVQQCKNEGCPLSALYCQDMSINSTLFHGIVSFMHEQGVKRCDYVTRLD